MEIKGSLLQLTAWWLLREDSAGRALVIMTTVLEILQLAVLRVVFKRTLGVEHLDHLARPRELRWIVLIGTLGGLLFWLGLVQLDETDLGPENFAWVFILKLVCVDGYPNG